MKKLLALSAVLLIWTLSACAPVAPAYTFSGTFQTWEAYEQAVYKVERFYYPEEKLSGVANLSEDEDKNQRLPIGQGTMTVTIEVLDGQTFSVTQDLTFTYIDEGVYTKEALGEDEFQRFSRFMSKDGKKFFSQTDTMTVKINIKTTESNPFEPVYVEKTVDQKSTGDKLTMSYDYKTKKLIYELNGDKGERVVSGAGVYDSEQLFLFFRLLSPDFFKAGSTVTINNVVNWTDTVINGGKAEKLSFAGVASDEAVKIENDDFAQDLGRDGDFTALEVSIRNQSAGRKGTAIKAYYNLGVLSKGNKTSNRLLIRARQVQYDTQNAANTLVLATEYNIVSINFGAQQ